VLQTTRVSVLPNISATSADLTQACLAVVKMRQTALQTGLSYKKARRAEGKSKKGTPYSSIGENR